MSVRQVTAGRVDAGVFHPQRLEDRFAKICFVALAGNFFDDQAQQYVAGVGVVVFVAGVEVVWIVLERFD